MKLEHVEENEKNCTLEAQLAWNDEQVIEEYKKSSAFKKLLDDEYD